MAPTRSALRTTVAGAVLMMAAACGGDNGGNSPAPTSGTSGSNNRTGSGAAPEVETFPVPSRNHVQGRVNYPQTPPVGGDHNPVWQNCGFYSAPIEPELGVHSLEHGAVWITYRPNLPKGQVDALRQLAQGRAYVLVSPWRDNNLPSPVVASAWGLQLKVSNPGDAALTEFVRTRAGGPQSPEPGAPCTGAFGTPE